MVPVVLITFILFLAYYAYRRKQIDKVNTQKNLISGSVKTMQTVHANRISQI